MVSPAVRRVWGAPVRAPGVRSAAMLAFVAAAHLGLLAALDAAVGLNALAWAAGTAYAVVLGTLLDSALRRSGRTGLGPADRVTLARAVLVGGVTALVLDHGGGAQTAVLVAVATVALIMDGIDGNVARRTGTVSPLGARFDMEVDAFLILVLSAHVALSLGPWVLCIGLMRYVFVAAAWELPWLRAALPPRSGRKVVAALQGILLVVASAGLLPTPAAALVAGAALASLTWSFGRDIAWLRRHRCGPALVEKADLEDAGAASSTRLLAPRA